MLWSFQGFLSDMLFAALIAPPMLRRFQSKNVLIYRATQQFDLFRKGHESDRTRIGTNPPFYEGAYRGAVGRPMIGDDAGSGAQKAIAGKQTLAMLRQALLNRRLPSSQPFHIWHLMN